MSASRPLVLVNGLLQLAPEPKLELGLRYADSVRAAGGTPLALAPGADPAESVALLAQADALLLTGGDDFDTERLGLGPTHPAAVPTPPARQDEDLALARAALATGVPVLGICYGMQLLAVAEGGALLQHLPEDRPGSREHRGGVVHPVLLDEGTKLARAAGVRQVDVVSRHHQAVASVAPPWRAVARDDEGLVEAIERDDHPFAVGVQWHPELSPADGPHGRLFEALVAAARARALARARDDAGAGRVA